MLHSRRCCLAVLALLVAPLALSAQGVVYQGGSGPGKGKHIVLVSGDEEYRSEEALPQLGKILAKHHGFKCTVLFAIDPKDGTINPNVSNIPGLEALKTADLLVLFTRFRHLPDEQMKYLADYIESGKPIIGMRTATHAFAGINSPAYAKYNYNGNAQGYAQGFGRQVLGETWISHHGKHKVQSTRGILATDPRTCTTRSSPASPMATSGARPTCTASACRCLATACRWSSVRCSRG